MNDFLGLQNSPHFSVELTSDPIEENYTRQVKNASFSYVKPVTPSNPEILHVSEQFLNELNLTINDKKEFLKIVSGEQSFHDFKSYAMCYGGHQFGHWAGQLGDGRAINIAEIDINNTNWKFQLKGAGPTPYSRRADGFAVLRSSIREYLCSEAMHNLGIATTRALSIVKTGDLVTRDMLYNGNPKDEQGAIVCRVSPSFIRFGSFEIFAARQDVENLKKLTDYIIKHHFPTLGKPSKETYLAFFKEVCNRTKDMIIHWQRVGFVHGVMNTDNMSILGLTIDYGPYGWLEDYNPLWTPNTTDAQNKRYRFGNQPNMALWNLTHLANALYPLIEDVPALQTILEDFKHDYLTSYSVMMLKKLGLYNIIDNNEFLPTLEKLLHQSEVDMTIFFRTLSDKQTTNFEVFWESINNASYLSGHELVNHKTAWQDWYVTYLTYINIEKVDALEREQRMKAFNPKYVLRNYMVQLAIDDAEKGDYNLIDELYKLIQNPYDDQPDMEKWYTKRPDWAKHKVGCSMLSCSS